MPFSQKSLAASITNNFGNLTLLYDVNKGKQKKCGEIKRIKRQKKSRVEGKRSQKCEGR